MLEAVRQYSDATTKKILAIRDLQAEFRGRYAETSQGMSNVDFLTVLFDQPYCRIQNVVDNCGVSRPTATKYLDALTGTGIASREHHKSGYQQREYSNEDDIAEVLRYDGQYEHYARQAEDELG